MSPSPDTETGAGNDAMHDLATSRQRIERLSAPATAGIYGIYVREPGMMAPFPKGENGLIYIGLSTNLADREFEMHFSSEGSRVSTLRRSIGAILKQTLGLQARPRASGPSETNVVNYRFDREGEDRLTSWMERNLEVGVHATNLYESLETSLIGELKPLLNLTKWPNPNRKEIKGLRRICADEARVARAQRGLGDS